MRKPRIKIVNRQEPSVQQPQQVSKSVDDPNIWSKAVRLWIDQYRCASADSVPAFDRLFKDIVSPGAPFLR
jgi:hypothetical protein